MFNTKNVSEGSEYLRMGINHDVTIVEVQGVNEEGKTPYIAFKLALTANLDAANEFRFYFSEKATKMSMSKIKHIATKVVTEKQIDNIVASTIEEYATMLNAALSGRRLRILLNGKEYLKNDGTIGIRTELPINNFAEAIDSGAEYASVANEDTRLGKEVLQKLTVAPDASSFGNTGSTETADW